MVEFSCLFSSCSLSLNTGTDKTVILVRFECLFILFLSVPVLPSCPSEIVLFWIPWCSLLFSMVLFINLVSLCSTLFQDSSIVSNLFIDLLIVEEDGTANIYDWKFMSVAKGAEDVAWYKQGAYGIQLGTYKKILLDNYGVKQVGKNRAVPIIMDLKRENPQDPTTKLQIKGIEIGSVDPNKIDKLTLTPVSEESEKLIMLELQEFQELKLLTDLNRFKNQMLEQNVVSLISEKLEMTTFHSLSNAKHQLPALLSLEELLKMY